MSHVKKGDELCQCPFDKTHMIMLKNFSGHLTKCQKNYPNRRFLTCAFDVTHKIPVAKYRYHLENCPSRQLMIRDQQEAADQGNRLTGNVIGLDIVPAHNTVTDEDWEANANYKAKCLFSRKEKQEAEPEPEEPYIPPGAVYRPKSTNGSTQYEDREKIPRRVPRAPSKAAQMSKAVTSPDSLTTAEEAMRQVTGHGRGFQHSLAQGPPTVGVVHPTMHTESASPTAAPGLALQHPPGFPTGPPNLDMPCPGHPGYKLPPFAIPSFRGPLPGQVTQPDPSQFEGIVSPAAATRASGFERPNMEELRLLIRKQEEHQLQRLASRGRGRGTTTDLTSSLSRGPTGSWHSGGSTDVGDTQMDHTKGHNSGDPVTGTEPETGQGHVDAVNSSSPHGYFYEETDRQAAPHWHALSTEAQKDEAELGERWCDDNDTLSAAVVMPPFLQFNKGFQSAGLGLRQPAAHASSGHGRNVGLQAPDSSTNWALAPPRSEIPPEWSLGNPSGYREVPAGNLHSRQPQARHDPSHQRQAAGGPVSFQASAASGHGLSASASAHHGPSVSTYTDSANHSRSQANPAKTSGNLGNSQEDKMSSRLSQLAVNNEGERNEGRKRDKDFDDLLRAKRKVHKKLKQIANLEQRLAMGETLSADEEEKLRKKLEWTEEYESICQLMES